ncbi:MAG: hypothetical protein ABWY25_11760 [Paenisporosarcina sp.]
MTSKLVWFKGTYKGIYTEIIDGEPWVAFDADDVPPESEIEIDDDQG